MGKKIVIFDLDGTLLDTLEDLTFSLNFVLNSFGYEQKTLAQVQSYIGNGISKLIERAIPNGGENLNYEMCISLFKECYKNNMFNNTKPYKGIINLLNKIKEKGIIIAVVSNKFDFAVKKLCDNFFYGLVDYALGENESNSKNIKPSPKNILNILDCYKIQIGDALYVGDSDVDIKTAINAGILCVSVSWGYKSKDFLIANGAEIIVDNPKDIIDYL